MGLGLKLLGKMKGRGGVEKVNLFCFYLIYFFSLNNLRKASPNSLPNNHLQDSESPARIMPN